MSTRTISRYVDDDGGEIEVRTLFDSSVGIKATGTSRFGEVRIILTREQALDLGYFLIDEGATPSSSYPDEVPEAPPGFDSEKASAWVCGWAAGYQVGVEVPSHECT